MWKIRAVEKEVCGKLEVWKIGVWKTRSVENV